MCNSLKIVVADNDEFALRIVRQCLENLGHEMVDVSMPKIDGTATQAYCRPNA